MRCYCTPWEKIVKIIISTINIIIIIINNNNYYLEYSFCAAENGV